MLAKSLYNRQKSLKYNFYGWLQPLILAKIACKMPTKMNQKLVDITLNQLFQQQILDGDFDFLQHSLLQIQIEDADLWFGLSFTEGQLKTTHFNHQATSADATLSIKTKDAILLIEQQIDPDTLFFQRRLKIAGDTQLAHQAKNTIDSFDPEKLPRLVVKLLTHYRKKVLNIESNLSSTK